MPPIIIERSANKTGPVTVSVTQHIKSGYEKDFEKWLQGISSAAEKFPGHQGIYIVRPSKKGQVYTYIFRFDNYEHLQVWENSPEKKSWVEKLSGLIEVPAKKQIVTGLEYWFTLPNDPTLPSPPRYKMALLTILTIYPLSTAISYLLSPFLLHVHPLLRSLLISIILVCLMTYLIMPRVTRLFTKWLFPAKKND